MSHKTSHLSTQEVELFLNGKCAPIRRRASAHLISAILLFTSSLFISAQTVSTAAAPSSGTPIALAELVRAALRDYPLIHVSQEELNASVANVQLARSAYLPKADGLLQANRGTRNNVFGTLLPQATIPAISGPVIGSNNAGTVWGSAAGILVSWQPFDFGVRHANVTAAQAARDRAAAALRNSQLEVGLAAADAFLTLLAAEETLKAGNEAVTNWETLLQSIHALAAAQLRPGADESRIEAELAMARTQLVYARQAEISSRATLSKFLPHPAVLTPILDPGHLLTGFDPAPDTTSFDTARHPLMQEQRATVAHSAAQLHAFERSWVPQFTLEGAASSRGTGARTDGERLTGLNGLAPNVQNYAAGLNISFPFMDFASVHAHEAAQAATLRADQAREQLLDRTLTEQFQKASASLEASREVANNTPIELRAAQISFDQAKARYRAGLTPIDDLAQAQRLLVQAQVDDSIAHLNVWRALLQLDALRADMESFLQAVSR